MMMKYFIAKLAFKIAFFLEQRRMHLYGRRTSNLQCDATQKKLYYIMQQNTMIFLIDTIS